MSRIFDNYIPDKNTSLNYVPTRLTQTPKTCLDHIYFNFSGKFFAGVLQTSKSDHFATFCCILNWLERYNICFKPNFKNHSEEIILALRRDLTSTLNNFKVFSELSINVEIIFLDLLIQTAYFTHCSKKKKL